MNKLKDIFVIKSVLKIDYLKKEKKKIWMVNRKMKNNERDNLQYN